MEVHIINGQTAAAKVYAGLHDQVAPLKAAGITPGLAVVVVGLNPASLTYVRRKAETCLKLGFLSVKHELPENTPQEELLDLIAQLNADPCIHGILVQSPPPPHIDEAAIVRAIDPAKDVDGFHPVNVAKLILGDESGFVPCTPLGCQRLLVESGIDTRGARAVIVGRSMIVGKPMALLLMRKGAGADATVTVAHSATRDLPAITREADILIAALGKPRVIGPHHVKEGAVVIDVGINRIDDPTAPKGRRLVGDVDFEAVAPKCRAITPVPGGVGPMTIAMLMANTLKAASRGSPL